MDCSMIALSLLEDAATFTSYALNIILIWFILRWTPLKLKDYSRSLLINCFVDLAFTTANYVIRPIISTRGSVALIASLGPFANAELPQRFAIYCSFFVFQYAVVFAATVPFIYRYFRLCRKYTIGYAGLLGMQFIGALVALSVSVAVYEVFRPYAVAHPVVPEADQCVLHGSAAFMDMADPTLAQLLVVAYCCIILSANYGIIVACNYKFFAVLRAAHKGGRVSRAGKQITLVMSLQAVTPLVLAVAPIGAVMVTLMTGYNATRLVESTYAFLIWLPVLNPFYALVFVSGYRKILFQRLDTILPSGHVHSSSMDS